jgi:predicted nucleic acid-binding protein
MASYVLDTNIVSLILRGDTQVRENFEKIVNPDNIILGCPVVWYELRRGPGGKRCQATGAAF